MKKVLILLSVILLGVIPLTTLANAEVNGSYKKRGAKAVDIILSISGTAPAAVIVKQQIPPGNKLISSSPKSKGARGKVATWMFKRIDAKKLTIKMDFEKDVQPEALSGEIRFKEKGSGDMITKKIR